MVSRRCDRERDPVQSRHPPSEELLAGKMQPCLRRPSIGSRSTAKRHSVKFEMIVGLRIMQIAGVDMDADSSGKAALHMAAWHGALDNVILLLDRGCDVC